MTGNLKYYATLAGVLVILAALFFYGSANISSIKYSCNGTSDYSYAEGGVKGRISAVDANVNVESTTSREAGSANVTHSDSAVFEGASGGYRTKYESSQTGAGRTISQMMNRIIGNFSGSSKYSFTKTPSGDESVDSYITIEAPDGANVRYRVYNRTTKMPATAEELDLFGSITLEILNNYTDPFEKKLVMESWLGSCADLDKDDIHDTSVADSIYFPPEGKHIENGKLVADDATNSTSEEPIAYDVWDEDGTHRTYNQGNYATTYANGTKETIVAAGGIHQVVDANNKPVIQNVGLSGTGRIEGTGTGDGTGHINNSVYR